jgi:hypothetical protein
MGRQDNKDNHHILMLRFYPKEQTDGVEIWRRWIAVRDFICQKFRTLALGEHSPQVQLFYFFYPIPLFKKLATIDAASQLKWTTYATNYELTFPDNEPNNLPDWACVPFPYSHKFNTLIYDRVPENIALVNEQRPIETVYEEIIPYITTAKAKEAKAIAKAAKALADKAAKANGKYRGVPDDDPDDAAGTSAQHTQEGVEREERGRKQSR